MDKKIRQRLDALFADLERLAHDSINSQPEIRRELESLRTRLLELEREIVERDVHQQPPASATRVSLSADHPILYESDRAGYVYTSGETLPLRDYPQEELRGNKQTVVVSLIAGEQPIGELAIEPSVTRTWTAEEMKLVNAIARQVSMQVQNIRLLESAERARVQTVEASRRFIHEHWDSFLDAIQRNDRLGYAYDQDSLKPCEDHHSNLNGAYQESITVLEERVGMLALNPDPAHPFTEQDRVLIAAVAKQIAQQVENIRLLADASRARAEAEEATRRWARENWETYTAHAESNLGFAYSMNKVVPVVEASSFQRLDYSHPLSVRGATIGHLSFASKTTVTPEDTEFLSKIAERASAQIETLRLTEELQRRATELMELDRLKSAFLANMSHELRTPLNSILGFTDVIIEGLDGPLTPNMENDLKLIQKNGKHLLHLINDVLDMAKIESGTLNLTVEAFNLHETIEEIVSITSPLASEKDIALFIEPNSDRNMEIIADRTRLRQVLLNLVNNAVKFTDKGTISLCAVCERNSVLITVRDTGIGIPAVHLESIFQEFTQVDSSTTRKTGGTGLGLPISRRLIEMHGGRLWAESKGIEGEGSTFTIYLPIEAKIEETEPDTKGK